MVELSFLCEACSNIQVSKFPTRSILKWILISGFCALLVILGVQAFWLEPSSLNESQIEFKDWPGPDLKIAFFSDLHAGAPYIDLLKIDRLVAAIMAHKPDMILIGGDLVIRNIVGGKPLKLADLGESLGAFKAPLGVFAVFGNHDWWGDTGEISRVLSKAGIFVIDNEAFRIEKDGKAFWLLGLGDDYTKHSDPIRAFKGTESEPELGKILFMHDPGSLLDVKQEFSFAFAGHMHGGQVYFPGVGALITPGRAPREWAQGWVTFKLGTLFVSRGVGTSIMPVRWNSPPEYVILSLTPRAGSATAGQDFSRSVFDAAAGKGGDEAN